MKITYHWMREFTPLTVTAAQLAEQLTLAGLEVETVTPVAPPFSGVVVGQVLECGRHPDAEKLSLCQVTTDGTNRLQIICGASNVRMGLKVAVATVGAQLRAALPSNARSCADSNPTACCARRASWDWARATMGSWSWSNRWSSIATFAKHSIWMTRRWK